MLRQRKKRQNNQLKSPFSTNFVPYHQQNVLKKQQTLSSNLINQNCIQKMIPFQQIKIVSEKYLNQRHFIKTQRPYLLLKEQKNYLVNNKENIINSKLSLKNLTINPRKNLSVDSRQNMFLSNVNLNQTFVKFKKLSSLKTQRPKSVSSFQLNRNEAKILEQAVKNHQKISASKALLLFSQILKNQKAPIQKIRRKSIGQSRYKSVNVLANKVLIIQKQPVKKLVDYSLRQRPTFSEQNYRKKRKQDDFQLNGWQNSQHSFWQDSNQKIIKN